MSTQARGLRQHSVGEVRASVIVPLLVAGAIGKVAGRNVWGGGGGGGGATLIISRCVV